MFIVKSFFQTYYIREIPIIAEFKKYNERKSSRLIGVPLCIFLFFYKDAVKILADSVRTGIMTKTVDEDSIRLFLNEMKGEVQRWEKRKIITDFWERWLFL